MNVLFLTRDDFLEMHPDILNALHECGVKWDGVDEPQGAFMLLRNRLYDLLFVDVDIFSLAHHQILLGMGIPTMFVCPPGQRENVKQIYETFSNGVIVKESMGYAASIAATIRYFYFQLGMGDLQVGQRLTQLERELQFQEYDSHGH